MRKFLFILLPVVTLSLIFVFLYMTAPNKPQASDSNGTSKLKILSPFSSLLDEKTENPQQKEETKKSPENIYMMLLGIDRRSRAESAYRTDVMILLAANPTTNKALLISIPRDLWYNGQRLNAVFINEGWENFQQAIGEVTGITPQKYILTDFKDFSWIVDAMGGVEVSVDTSFVDTNYPIDETFEYQTISFSQGPTILNGPQALIYSRSRKGTNGEGSDWARMKRQHKILVGMLDAVVSPKSIFNPMIVENAFQTVTTGKMDTNLSIADAKYLWDFYKDKDKYTIDSMFLDYDYLYSPPLDPESIYGGAWVLVPTSGDYELFKTKVTEKLNNIIISSPTEDEITNQSNTEM